jgi:protein tyrosine/serine phosphatase
MGTTDDPRHLFWDACYNVRDLGGFATRDGRETRWRAVVRSDNLCRLTSHGRRALVRYGIRTVIDLRSADELLLETDPFSRGDLDDVGYVSAPLMTEEFIARYEAGLDELFEIVLLDRCPDAVAALFTAIAVAPLGGIVVYCHAGKERTGVAAALLLALAGVASNVIAAEYALSDTYLGPLFSAWLASEPDALSRERAARSLITPPDRMSRVLAHMRERYGGVEPYLQWTGVDRRDLRRVSERIVA